MQQTRLDRWLKQRFAMETHVYCLSSPPWVPQGIALTPLKTDLKNRFRFHMVIRNQRELQHTLDAMKSENQTFTTRVQARDVWFRKLLDDPYGASFTFRLLWIGMIILITASLVFFLPRDLLSRLEEAFLFLRRYI